MSQFYGYTVDVVLKEAGNPTIRGVIERIAEHSVALKNPTARVSDGVFEKMSKKEVVIDTSNVMDLNVVELARNNNKYIKKQMKMLKGQEQGQEQEQREQKDRDRKKSGAGDHGDARTEKNGKSNRSGKNGKNSTNGGSRSDTSAQSVPVADTGSASLEPENPKKELEVKYVDIYNEKPSNVPKKSTVLEEFDFASNLEKFDKESVFKNISKNDKVDQSARLVSFNKVANKKDKYGIDEMVLKKKHDKGWEDNDNFGYSDIIKSGDKATSRSDSNFSEAGAESSAPASTRQASTASFDRKSSLTPTFAQFYASIYDENPVPTCSTLQLSEIFNLCQGKFGLTEQIMNENAGRSIGEIIINNIIGSFRIGFKNHNEPPLVMLLVGNNRAGAVALTVARHLFNSGVKTVVFLLYDSKYSEDDLLFEVDEELKRYSNIGGKIVNTLGQLESVLHSAQDSPLEFILDGLQGFDSDLNDLVEGEFELAVKVVQWCNDTKLPILSIDVPSGITPSSGTNENDERLIVNSKYVVSVGLPLSSTLNMYKFGYFEKGKVSHFVADCGIPRRVYSSKSSLRKLDRPWFADTATIALNVV